MQKIILLLKKTALLMLAGEWESGDWTRTWNIGSTSEVPYVAAYVEQLPLCYAEIKSVFPTWVGHGEASKRIAGHTEGTQYPH